jgi:DNA helicase-2/ATP-dependent DNA helicase PcrA
MKLITAGPGAGKTQRLVSSITEKLKEGVSPFMVLATTFTREAAREIEERSGGDVPIRTIHGLAYWIIRLSRKSRQEVIPRVLSDDGSLALMERSIKELGFQFIEPRQALEDMARVRDHGGSFDDLHPQVCKLIDRYFSILSSENKVDFTGILEEAQRELCSEDLREFLKGKHILVDEAQDVNPATEWPILDVLRSGAEDFTMFASPSQQIYGFRGADWEKLTHQFPGSLSVETMSKNYRSTPEIIRAAIPLAGNDASSMVPVRESLKIPVLAVEALNSEMEADFIGKQVVDWLNHGIDANEIAILARVHTTLNAIQLSLRTRNIPFQIVGGRTSIFHREDTQAVLGYLRLALDPMDDAVLESVVNFPPCGIGVRTRYSLRGDDMLNWDHFLKALSEREKFRTQVIQRIHQILDLREHFELLVNQDRPLLEIVRRVIDLSSIPNYLNSEGDFQSVRSVNELISASSEYSTLNEYVEYLETEVRRPREPEGIQLSTIHASKGREWIAVVIPAFQDGMLPLERADPVEEKNLAFVGMTRAKTHLVLTLNRAFPPSPFLSKLPLQNSQWPLL